MPKNVGGRRTKIIATLGPASRSPEMIGRLIDAGVNIFRLNFSHETREGHGESLRRIRAAARERNAPIGVLQDLQGPKIRIGALDNHRPVNLVAGEQVRITTRQVPGTAECLSTTYQALPDDVRIGDAILIDDGRLHLVVRGVEGKDVKCEVLVGGPVREHKGMNLPKTPLSAPCLTRKDRDDLAFGLKAGVDFVGLSFVRQASDIEAVRKEARESGKDVFVIAKIERVEAIANLEAIVEAADGVMVARGDLGVETSAAEVPLLQKRILSIAGRMAKPDITATQMLETMVANPQPTRAEATDIANSVFDGTDAVMLSEETAVGRYPVEAVRTMSEITMMAEEHLSEYERPVNRDVTTAPVSVAKATVQAACAAARHINAAAIAVFTLSGRTAFLVAGVRPSVPVVAFTPEETTCNRLSLAWGVKPMRTEFVKTPDQLIAVADRDLCADGLVKRGESVVLLTGTATVPGATNIMRIHRVGAK